MDQVDREDPARRCRRRDPAGPRRRAGHRTRGHRRADQDRGASTGLGGSSLFHAGLPRGSIDWISVPAWPIAKTNVADIVIVIGVLALLYHSVRRVIRAAQALARRRRVVRLAAAAAGVIAVAIWTPIWQADRHSAELGPTTRSETPSQCGTAPVVYSSDGMDWVSYRSAAGPLLYHPTASEQAFPGCPKQQHVELKHPTRAPISNKTERSPDVDEALCRRPVECQVGTAFGPRWL